MHRAYMDVIAVEVLSKVKTDTIAAPVCDSSLIWSRLETSHGNILYRYVT